MKLKKELANEIHNWNGSHQWGIQKWDFSGIFGHAYLQAFTSELVKSAWEAVGIYPYNSDIIPLDKLAPSKALTIQLTAASALHSTPVQKIMSAFSYFNESHEQVNHNSTRNDTNNNANNPNNDTEGGPNALDNSPDTCNNGPDTLDNNTEGGPDGLNNGPNGPNNGIEGNPNNSTRDDPDDSFLPSFTPRSHIHILHRSFASNSSTSYLVSKEAVKSSLNLVKPVNENPYFIQEPDWSLIQKHTMSNFDWASCEKLLERCQALEIALNCAEQQIRARDAVIKASHATAAILELQAQKLQSALHMKEEGRKHKEKKTVLLNVGDGAVITEDEFIEKVEAKKKAQEKKKKDLEGRKRVREKKHLLKNMQREAWEVVCSEYEVEKARHERLCQELREKGTKVCDLPPKPKQHLQKEVFQEVREKWEQEVETSEDLMDVDGETSEFDNNCEVEMSLFHGEDDKASLGWSDSSGKEEWEDNEEEDLMDVDEP